MKKKTFAIEVISACLVIGGFVASKFKTSDFKQNTNSIISNNQTLEVYFIDVGQGDSTLIIDGDEAMLIDGGLPSASQKIYSFLENKNINHLKYIVATHAHNDHVGGLSAALEQSSCDEILVPYLESDNERFQSLLSKAHEKEVSILQAKDGETYSLKNAEIKILGPTDMIENDDNNNSLVFRLDYKNVSFLFTGDAEQMEEQLLLYNHYDDLSVDVLKVGHHGSHNAASSAWMEAVNPQYAVISCGKDNSYGHPHEETLQLLEQQGTTIYRTDLQGTIHCSTDGYDIIFDTEKESNEVQTNSNDNEINGYVLNTSSKKFHSPNCDSVETISKKNKLISNKSREELIEEGYTPCGKCNP